MLTDNLVYNETVNMRIANFKQAEKVNQFENKDNINDNNKEIDSVSITPSDSLDIIDRKYFELARQNGIIMCDMEKVSVRKDDVDYYKNLVKLGFGTKVQVDESKTKLYEDSYLCEKEEDYLNNIKKELLEEGLSTQIPSEIKLKFSAKLYENKDYQEAKKEFEKAEKFYKEGSYDYLDLSRSKYLLIDQTKYIMKSLEY